ncbi:MAG: aromatic ring-hydroxylating oxygenase subunit alpha [Dehalococcoidia bacterium]
MVETLTGTNRSAGVSYQQLLDQDSKPVPEFLRIDSPLKGGPVRVPVERYFSKEFHDLEVKKVWSRVWQMACHLDDIPEVGDYHVYNIAHLSFLIVRSKPDEVKAFVNGCLHRGRLIREVDGKRAHDLRCAFHGWAWNLDGSLHEIPCQWDFQYLKPEDVKLPEAKVGIWHDFIFINPDPDAEPLEAHLGDLDRHFVSLPYEKRFKQAHVAKVLRCNWKQAQEAFMEAYHVVATHPQILAGIGDANSKYDAFENYSRAISPGATPSPHLSGYGQWDPLPDAGPTKVRHPLSGSVYELRADGFVHVTTPNGRTGVFRDDGSWVDGELGQADPNMCNWVGPHQLPARDGAWDSRQSVRNEPPPDLSPRAASAAWQREQLRPVLGGMVDGVCDAEFNDSIYFTLFPNLHPWGAFNRIVYRFRPNGDNPDEAIMECMFFAPYSPDMERPPAAPVHWLGTDEDWVEAPELGMLAKVFDQDTYNLPQVQKGLKAMRQPYLQFGEYGETKIRHFHMLLERWITRE